MAARKIRMSRSILLILVVGAVIGVVSVMGTDAVLRTTETNEFCVSCHVMEATVYEELKETLHYKNRLGFQVGCADCHLPDKHLLAELPDYFAVKLGASRFVFGWATGQTSEPQQLLDRRLEMAERVWAEMRKNDSRGCRKCHNDQAWDLSAQTQRAKVQHEDNDGKTCIDCHDEGVAHKAVERPDEPSDEDDPFSLDSDEEEEDDFTL
jgi:nitrate/TMAO reductase-like tetraheme cytochrome c subunit